MIPSAETVRRASEILQQIESLQNELTGLFGGAGSVARGGRAVGGGGGGKRRKMSPEARARIAAAARARWARYRADKKASSK